VTAAAQVGPAEGDTAVPVERVPYKWKLLASVIFGVFMSTLDTTAVNVAFPTLRAEYGASLQQSQWIVSIYVLALGIATPVAGFLADRFGIKRIYILGLATFVAGSLLAGLAPTLGVLVAARALKGIGGGLAMPCATAMLFRGFARQELGFALGVFGFALLFAPALGPVLAGVLIDHHHWRWIFFINVPIGTLGITLASRFLRERRATATPKWDAWGLPLAATGFGSLLYGASIVADRGWTATDVIGAFGLGGAALLGLGLVELRHAPEPLLDLRLFRRRSFVLPTAIGYITVVSFFGAEFLLPVYLQAVRGYSASEAGIALLPLALGAGLTMPAAGKIYDRLGPRLLVVLGFALLCYNTWNLAHLGPGTSYRFILLLMAVRGIALGLAVQAPFTAALASVPHDATPRASSLVISTRLAVQAIGIAVLATLLASALPAELRAAHRGSDRRPGIARAEAPAGGACRGAVHLRQTSQSGDPVNAGAACDAYLDGFARAYGLTFLLATGAFLLGLALPGWPGRWDPAAQGSSGDEVTS
jgi:EmrB/QacA subfamily drug resistance transporter